MTPRRKKLLTMAVLLVIVAAAAAFGVWRMLGDAPEEVSLAEAVADAEAAADADDAAGASTSGSDTGRDTSGDAGSTADDSLSADGDDNTTDGDGSADGDSDSAADSASGDSGGDAGAASNGVALTAAELDGTWAVDAETGEFTLEDATGSFAGFRVDEELARIGAFTAVGRTGDVSGSLEIADEHVTSVDIEVDLTTLRTDDSRRDGAVQRALSTSQHPTATFSLTEELHIEGAVELGESISLVASGDLTVNGITQPVTIDIDAQLVGSLIAVVGSVEIIFADFEVTVPQVPIVLSADDHGIMEFQLLFRQSG